ncbi:MAG: transglutaminase-like cysteine peptidase [Defluviicoccus sp.]
MHVAQGLLRSAAAATFAVALASALPQPVAAFDEGAGRGSEQAKGAGPSFFGSIATRSADLTPVAKWRAALDRHAGDRASACSVGATCLGGEWSTLVATLRPLAPAVQVVRVTAALNAEAYVTDHANWGMSDYWQTPREFLARGGDCEDFAIAKYLALREAGWAAEDLRVVVVIDERRAVGHAVLIASYQGKAWVLDNVTDEVVETDVVHHYQPVFSLSETAWWWHRPAADRASRKTTPASR